MPKSKTAEEKPTAGKTPTEAELKSKIKNMASIIEELSASSEPKDVEKVIEPKMREYNERVGEQIKELKENLVEMEKKMNSPLKTKNLEEMIGQLETKIQPKFSELEEKMKALDKIDTLEKSVEGIRAAKEEKTADAEAYKQHFENLGESIRVLSKSVAGMQEQMRALERLPYLERKLQVESVLDPQDVRKIEKVVSSIDQMIPKKIVDEKLKLFLENTKEFRKTMMKQKEDIIKDVTDQISRIEKRVEIMFKLQKTYTEILEKRLEDMTAEFTEQLEAGSDQVRKETLDFRNEAEILNKKNFLMMLDLEKAIETRVSLVEFERFKKQYHDDTDSINSHLKNLTDEISSLRRFLTDKNIINKDLERERHYLEKINESFDEKISQVQKNLEDHKALILREFRQTVDEKKELQNIVNKDRQKIGTILKKMVEK